MIDQIIDDMLEGKIVSENHVALVFIIDQEKVTFYIMRDLSASRQKIVLTLTLKNTDSLRPTINYLQSIDECLYFYKNICSGIDTCSFLMSDIDICDIVDALNDVLEDCAKPVVCSIEDQSDLSYENVIKLAYNIGALAEITNNNRNILKVVMPDNLLLSTVGMIGDFLSIVLEESSANGNIYNIEFMSRINDTEKTLNNIKKILSYSSIFDTKAGIHVYLRSSKVGSGMTEIYFSAKDSHHGSLDTGSYLERHGVMRMIDD